MAKTLSGSGPVVLPVSAARMGMNNSLPLAPVFLTYFIAEHHGLNLHIQWLTDEL
jgi:hypothetical protein